MDFARKLLGEVVKRKRKIRFIIDTCATHSSINKKDANPMKINIDILTKHSVKVRGVGGEDTGS